MQRTPLELLVSRLQQPIAPLRMTTIDYRDSRRDNLRPCILMVDDDGMTLAMLSSGVRKSGYEAWQASSAEAALQLIAQRKPDLAILDVEMPGMSGIELARCLRFGAGVPFIFLTSHDDDAMVGRALELGAVGYLVKPVDIRQVIPAIKAALSQSAEIARLLRAEAELDADLHLMQDQLIQADKLVSVGQLAAGIAQEIDEPMDCVQANVATLEHGMIKLFEALDALAARGRAGQAALHEIERAHELSFLREDMPALLAQTREGIRRVCRIVRELQDFSRVDALDRWQRVDLRHCLESTLQLLGSELRHKAELITEFGETPDIECLPGQVSQVIMNLLANALQAIGEAETGGRGRITIRSGSAGGQVWLEIEDNGCGIAPEHLKRIFHPFFTTRPAGTGTGLGLSLSCGIVQRHGGEIGVRSRLGEGAVFRVTLPQRQPQR